MSHTPTPWQRNIPPASKYQTIFSGRNTHVLALNTRLPPEEVEHNAAYLLKCVNTHDELVAALRGLLEMLETFSLEGDYRVIAAKAALAKVQS